MPDPFSSSDECVEVPRAPSSQDDDALLPLSHHARYAPVVTNPINRLHDSEGGKAEALNKVDMRLTSESTREFYSSQNEVIDSFIEMDELRRSVRQGTPLVSSEGDEKKASFAIGASLFVNILILVAKLVVVLQTGSVAFVASLLDSVLDLVSGLTLVITNKMVNDANLHKYPLGKKTFEPLGTLVFSCCMFTASFQLIQYAVSVLMKRKHEITVDTFSTVFIGGIIAAKVVLYIYCRRYRSLSNSVAALASDHRNDILSNSFGVGAAYIGVMYWWRVDPICAILITFYIMYTWATTGYEQIMMLSGRSAPPGVLQQITWCAKHHHPAILFVDTVRAVALGGSGYQVEVDIVLPPNTLLREAHDIGESLQIVLERADYVSRAYVHIDYEFDHPPWDHR